MATLVLNIPAFRVAFPAFADEGAFPKCQLEAMWATATCYVSDCNYGTLRNGCREYAISLMMAHLMALSVIVASGQIPATVNASSIDVISVSLTVAPATSQFAWWLNLTPYGQNLSTLLAVRSAGGWYVGGRPETDAFRKVYGVH